MVIKAVIFDFGGTLAEGSLNYDSYHSAIIDLLRSIGYSIDAGRLRRAIASALERLEKVRSMEQELTLEEVYAQVLSDLGIPPEQETLKGIHELYRRHFEVTLYPCVEEVLSKLSKRFKLAIISNTMSDNPRFFLKRASLIGYFQLIVCSSDLGIRKPNPKIFQYVIERLGVDPSEAIHVGDGVDTDMEGASRAGLKGIWIRRTDETSWTGPTISSVCDLPKFLEKFED